MTAADIAEWQRVDRVFADACAAHGRPIVEHMSTANVVRDLDLLRPALGDPRLNYSGYAGWGHKAYLTRRQHLRRGGRHPAPRPNTLPARGTVCQPQGTPFEAPADVTLPIPPQTPAF